MPVVLAYLVCALVWGTTWYAIRVCIGPGGYPTILAAALRFTIAAIVLALIVWPRRVRPDVVTRRRVLWLVVAGLLNAAGYGLVYLGEESVSGGLTAVVFGTSPLLTALLAAATRTERVHFSFAVGALLSLLGIAIIFWDRLSVSAEQARGIVLVLTSVLSFSIYSIILKREGTGVHPLFATAIFLTTTAVALWAVELAGGLDPLPAPIPLEPTLALFYLAIFGSVITFACFVYLIGRVSLMTTTTLVFVEPVIALFVDSIWDERAQMGARSYAGAAVTLMGVLVAVALRRRSSEPLAVRMRATTSET